MKFISDFDPSKGVVSDPSEVRLTTELDKLLFDCPNLPGYLYRAHNKLCKVGYLTVGDFFKLMSPGEIQMLSHMLQLTNQGLDDAVRVVYATVLLMIHGEGQVDFVKNDLVVYTSRLGLYTRMVQLHLENKLSLNYQGLSMTDPDPGRAINKKVDK